VYTAELIDRALDASRAGSAGPGAYAGEAGDPACGDTVRIELELQGEAIAAARHRTFGCPHATAAAALLCALVEGRGLLDAAAVGVPDIERELVGRPGCVALAVDALHAAIGRAADGLRIAPVDGRVAVAMSGGVDSAVALLKAVEAGLQPVGVTLRLWIDPQAPDSERACCSPQSVRAARSACHALGVPHVALDRRDGFRRAVVEEFVTAYAAGSTPNPCVRCNGSFRFDTLAAFADRIGAERLVTGHYARIRRRFGVPLVARALDDTKDQSYMLARVPSAMLERVWFPLGEQRKTQTRAEATAAGMAAAGRAESQEVCFVGGGDHRAFLERNGGAGTAGEITDERGTVLGRHTGVHRFTAGQRRGVGVSAATPLYVLRTDARTGEVVVGPRSRLARSSVSVGEAVLHRPVSRVQAKLRYRSDPVWATVVADGAGVRLELDEPAYGVAPGQAAVLYEGDTVVGAGTILA
jgi:tRNA-uridine 2-sulfurtransferase